MESHRPAESPRRLDSPGSGTAMPVLRCRCFARQAALIATAWLSCSRCRWTENREPRNTPLAAARSVATGPRAPDRGPDGPVTGDRPTPRRCRDGGRTRLPGRVGGRVRPIRTRRWLSQRSPGSVSSYRKRSVCAGFRPPPVIRSTVAGAAARPDARAGRPGTRPARSGGATSRVRAAPDGVPGSRRPASSATASSGASPLGQCVVFSSSKSR